MRAQRHEPGVLEPFPTQRDPDHRRLQVVVADHPGRHHDNGVERADVAVEERLLDLVGVSDMHGFVLQDGVDTTGCAPDITRRPRNTLLRLRE